MWGHMAIEAALSGVKHGMSFVAGVQESRAARAWQKYNNAMTRIANGQNQNVVTINEVMATERSVAQGYNIEVSEYVTRAAAEAEAAAKGTAGRSVNQTLFQIEQNATRAQAARKADLEATLLGYNNQRRMLDFQTAQQIDKTVIPNPSPITAMLGIAADGMKLYDKYNT